MSSMDSSPGVVPLGVEWPPKADLRKDVYKPLPMIPLGTINPSEIIGDAPTIQAKVVIDAFNNALFDNDVKKLASCFYTEQSVAIIGSANTAFDIIQDCHAAGLRTTMVARSPTYVYPYEYVVNPHGFGVYDNLPLEVADRLMYTLPPTLDGQFSHGLFSYLASQEPDRYLPLAKAGFPVLDSRNPSVDIQNILVERGGGHYVDVGGTNLISEGKVAVRGRVEPVGYTETGLRLSDGSVLDTDAVIWCTGFADKDVRTIALGVLGEADPDMTDVLGPKDIVARLDATWGVDAEGEVRGVWKRHLRMQNYWVMGGVIQQQRWWSRPMAQQIKLALEGDLPSAYRDTPEPN
ncbi:hypothetical protein GL218_06444 [Daldinia childiae]|uniref:uncharacterized protein n=1 Tax=Daldinia childiae TaxID=326645 RepID=UPI0014479F9C|nr:uncharacterized protein GL218_06444 [Daldinia childiae]KAF3056255.1 hypothetical protein GL218_06444 [Daldinia childiae]